MATLGRTYTISIDYNVCWQAVPMVLSEYLEGSLDTILQLAIHDFLTFLLYDVIAVILTQFTVD